eukprot:2550119-Rhodomonas_salina.2
MSRNSEPSAITRADSKPNRSCLPLDVCVGRRRRRERTWVYPTEVPTTPGTRWYASSRPQKQPPAKVAIECPSCMRERQRKQGCRGVCAGARARGSCCAFCVRVVVGTTLEIAFTSPAWAYSAASPCDPRCVSFLCSRSW